MENETLYPELREYIFKYCGHLFWRNHRFKIVLPPEICNASTANIAVYKFLLQAVNANRNTEMSDLINGGYDYYKQRISELIYRDYKNELVLNLCPKCNKVARTSKAKQCQFCFHTWYNDEFKKAD